MRHQFLEVADRRIDAVTHLAEGARIIALDRLGQVALRQGLGHTKHILEAGVGNIGELIEQLRQFLRIALLVGEVHLHREIAADGSRFDDVLDLGHDLRQGLHRPIDPGLGLPEQARVVLVDLLRQVAAGQRIGHARHVLETGFRHIRELVQQLRQLAGISLLVGEIHLDREVAANGRRFHDVLDLGHDLRQRVHRAIDTQLGLAENARVFLVDPLRQVAVRQRVGHPRHVLQPGLGHVGQLVQQLRQFLGVTALARQIHLDREVTPNRRRLDDVLDLGHDLRQRIHRPIHPGLRLTEQSGVVLVDPLRQVTARQRVGHPRHILEAGFRHIGKLVQELRQFLGVALLVGKVHLDREVAAHCRCFDDVLDLGHDLLQGRLHFPDLRQQACRVPGLDQQLLRQVALRHPAHGIRGVTRLTAELPEQASGDEDRDDHAGQHCHQRRNQDDPGRCPRLLVGLRPGFGHQRILDFDQLDDACQHGIPGIAHCAHAKFRGLAQLACVDLGNILIQLAHVLFPGR